MATHTVGSTCAPDRSIHFAPKALPKTVVGADTGAMDPQVAFCLSLRSQLLRALEDAERSRSRRTPR